ncbi:MAG: copper amine oxidase N-terminal domain-containing protein [Anaerotignum sp.]|nr:copper amine oxidase N-terminal domain-containing protein [Anaerotignum sp.]
MKRLFAMTMAFVMLFGTAVYAKEDENVKKFKVKANGEKIAFEVETEEHEIDCMHRARPEVKMTFEEKFYGAEEKLYFRIRWETPTMVEPDIDNYYIPPQIFSVALDDYKEETEKSFRLEFPKHKFHEETNYSLWLVGGDDYDDNFIYGYDDLLLVDEFVVYRAPKAAEVPVVEQTSTEVFLTVGKDTFLYNGEEKQVKAPVLFNDTGRLMVAAKDIPMVMEGATATGLTWDKATRTVTLQMGEKTLSATDGSSKWLYQGAEVAVDTVAEIRNGSLYIPLREVAKLFGFTELVWDGSTQTVRLFRNLS